MGLNRHGYGHGRGRGRRLLAAAAAAGVMLGAPVPGTAQAQVVAAASPVPPADPRPEWRVGFTELQPLGLAAANAYLASSIPRLLIERLASIRRHSLSPAERRAHRERILTAAARTVIRRLGAARERRSELQLAGGATAAVDAQIRDLELRMEELRFLTSTPERVAVALRKPLRIVGDAGGERLLPAPEFSALSVAQAADLDLLITGELEEFDDFFYLEITALETTGLATAGAQAVLTVRDVLPRAGVGEALAPLADALARLLLGEPWAVLTVEPDPAHAAVYVDGTFAGTGVTELPYQTLGPHQVRVTAHRHQPLARTVALTATGLRLALRLDPAAPRPLAVDSAPPGAALYLDSLYAGTTPLTVDASGEPAWALLRLPEHHAAGVLLSPETGGALQITLAPDGLDLEQWQSQQRDRFYRRFGEAVLSLAGPLVLFGAAGEVGQRAGAVGQRAAAGASAKIDRLQHSRDLLTIGGVASLAVSGALIVRMALALGDYLAATDRTGR